MRHRLRRPAFLAASSLRIGSGAAPMSRRLPTASRQPSGPAVWVSGNAMTRSAGDWDSDVQRRPAAWGADYLHVAAEHFDAVFEPDES